MSRLRPIGLRIASLAVGLFVTPMVAVAEGLPQLDFGNRLTTYQVVWGAVIFAVLYILASRTALPKVEAVLEERAKRIAGDLEGAKDAKARADAGIQAAAAATAQARSEAQAAINAALEFLEAGRGGAIHRAERAVGQTAQGSRGPDRGGAWRGAGGSAGRGNRYRRRADHPSDRRGAGSGAIERRDQRGHGRARRRSIRGNADA